MTRERQEYEENVKEIEERWSIEFMALGMRETHLQEECNKLKEESQRARIEVTRLAAEVAALEYVRNTRELSEGNQKIKAEREAKGALLAQQKLIVALTAQKESSEAQVILLKSECESLSASYERAVAEGMDFKQRAVSAEEELATMRPESSGSDSDKEQPEMKQVTAQDRDESSSKTVLNLEMDRYLSLQTSMPPPLPRAAAEAVYLYQFPQQESKFTDALSAATEGIRCADLVTRIPRSHGTRPTSTQLNIPNYVREISSRSAARYRLA